ncbi:MAG TPA: protease SohB [Pseudomonadales bacterium]|jgi:serine protease SohB|nr:protease SohB [Pseudomonadales bacterium]HNN86297.1 protease SohB [Pseudomonadales bacterium]
MEFLFEYGIFLAKTITIVVAIGFLLATLTSTAQRLKKLEKQGYVEVKNLNEKYEDISQAMQSAILSDDDYEAAIKAEKKAAKAKSKIEKANKKKHPDGVTRKPRLFVLDFSGDVKASDAEMLAEKITAILTQAKTQDEVVLRLESAGGMVHAYGFAASQLQRIRDKDIPLTVCVDKVAASGGYMMACIGSQIFAAPFAVIGSIGVVAQIPNFNRLLKKHDVDYEVLTAGEYKRTLTILGENTDKGREKFQQEIQETHDLFKSFVLSSRPSLNMDVVATGETWFGKKAIDLGLIDKTLSSEEYIFSRHPESDIYHVGWIEKHGIAERLGFAAETAVDRVFKRTLSEMKNRKIFLQ